MGKGEAGNYTRVLGGAGASRLGAALYEFALPLLVIQATTSAAGVAGLRVAMGVPWVLFSLVAGALADRVDRRVLLSRVHLARAAAGAALAALCLAQPAPVAIIYGLAFVLSALATAWSAAGQAIFPAVVPEGQLERAYGHLETATMLASFAGPFLGALLVGASLELAFAAGALASLAASALAASLEGSFVPERRQTGLRADIASGVRRMWQHQAVRLLSLGAASQNLCLGGVEAILVLYVVSERGLGAGPWGFAVVEAALIAGSIAGSLLAGRAGRRVGARRLLQLCPLVSALALVAIFAFPSLWVTAAAALFDGLALGTWRIISLSKVQSMIEDAERGRIMASSRLVSIGAAPVGAALAGVIGSRFGLPAVFLGAAAGLALTALWLALALRGAAGRQLAALTPSAPHR